MENFVYVRANARVLTKKFLDEMGARIGFRTGVRATNPFDNFRSHIGLEEEPLLFKSH